MAHQPMQCKFLLYAIRVSVEIITVESNYFFKIFPIEFKHILWCNKHNVPLPNSWFEIALFRQCNVSFRCLLRVPANTDTVESNRNDTFKIIWNCIVAHFFQKCSVMS